MSPEADLLFRALAARIVELQKLHAVQQADIEEQIIWARLNHTSIGKDYWLSLYDTQLKIKRLTQAMEALSTL